MIIEGTNMSMIRGDTESITIIMKNNYGEKIDFESGDIVYFTVKSDTKSDTKILQKVVTTFVDGNAEIFLSSNDTKDLPKYFSVFYYDVQINKISDGSITTIIPPSKFIIQDEITYE